MYRRTQGAGWQPQFSGFGRPMGWLHQGYLFLRIQFYQLSIHLRSSLHIHQCEKKCGAVFCLTDKTFDAKLGST